MGDIHYFCDDCKWVFKRDDGETHCPICGTEDTCELTGHEAKEAKESATEAHQ